MQYFHIILITSTVTHIVVYSRQWSTLVKLVHVQSKTQLNIYIIVAGRNLLIHIRLLKCMTTLITFNLIEMHVHGFLCAAVNPYHGWNTLQKRSKLGELNIDC